MRAGHDHREAARVARAAPPRARRAARGGLRRLLQGERRNRHRAHPRAGRHDRAGHGARPAAVRAERRTCPPRACTHGCIASCAWHVHCVYAQVRPLPRRLRVLLTPSTAFSHLSSPSLTFHAPSLRYGHFLGVFEAKWAAAKAHGGAAELAALQARAKRIDPACPLPSSLALTLPILPCRRAPSASTPRARARRTPRAPPPSARTRTRRTRTWSICARAGWADRAGRGRGMCAARWRRSGLDQIHTRAVCGGEQAGTAVGIPRFGCTGVRIRARVLLRVGCTCTCTCMYAGGFLGVGASRSGGKTGAAAIHCSHLAQKTHLRSIQYLLSCCGVTAPLVR